MKIQLFDFSKRISESKKVSVFDVKNKHPSPGNYEVPSYTVTKAFHIDYYEYFCDSNNKVNEVLLCILLYLESWRFLYNRISNRAN